MLQLTGRLIDIARTESKDRETGEIVQQFAAEILHKERGKSVIESLKFDPSCAPAWDKFVGKEIVVEVRPYAMKGNGGDVVSGLALADKKGYPNLLKVEPAVAPASVRAAA